MSLLFDGDMELLADIHEDDGYKFEALSTTRRGNPVPVEVVLASFLRDGSIVSKTGDENRELTIPVRVTGADSAVLALGEKRLNLATGKRTTLAWTPKDGIGATTVFEVLTSRLEEIQDDGWDLDEVRNVRTYGLRMTCLPFGRSVDPITDDADLPPAASGTVLNAWSTTTGWSSANSAPAPSVVSSSVQTASPSAAPFYTQSFTYPDGAKYTAGSGRDTWAGSVAVTAGDWLSAEVRFEWPEGSEGGPSEIGYLYQTLGGVRTTLDLHTAAADADGFVRYSWRVGATGNVTALEFVWSQSRPGWGGYSPPTVRYRNLRSTPAGATGLQMLRTTDVEGSARCPVSLHVYAPTDLDALGQVFVATLPAASVATGFLPDSLRWLASGTAVVDASALHGNHYVSGSNYGSTDSPVFEVPVSTLRPGSYHAYGLVRYSGDTIAVGVEAQLMPDGATPTGPTSTAEVTLPNAADVWRFVAVGTVDLPPVEMVNADAGAVVRIQTKGSGTKWAELLLLPASSPGQDGAEVTVVDCGTGTVSSALASSHLWIEAPTTARRYGGVFRGPTTDGLNRRSITLSEDLKKPGRHYFTPGLMNTYALATGVVGVRAVPTYTPHWFGNAGL